MKKHLMLLALTLGSCAFAEGLKDLARPHQLHIGAAIDLRFLLDDPDYTDILEKDFDVVVAENAMKMDATEPQQNEFSFGLGDLLAQYAEKHNMLLRGHTLLWHEQVPRWITAGTWTAEQLEAIMKNHIQTVADHFKGRVFAWDVVNEAISDAGGMRDTLWRKTLGDDFIARAFQYAHQADPAAKLFYNDYSSEALTRKSDDVYALVKSLKEKNVPLDGVGMQMHLNLNNPPSMADIAQNMKRLADLNLEVHITEFDVRSAGFPGTAKERNEAMAKLYSDVVTVCLQARNCTAFLTWGVADNHTWLPGDAPLLYDGFYNPKPAYFAVQEALKQPVAQK
ncbi:endo-1,4-beta-xylanase [Deinococcus roseus]|uniref:Beta-xylanase n=1 Tax=Deinococcus roseus TaxID=392414 RepID=A0ABQ2D0U7_9DEIO|nr:endo-1,4-beta-xylanase [Deinococcus roseus]GGJ28768.1 beta-xylanase [Deinococcus roseus]